MKKKLSLLLALVLVFALFATACSGGSTNAENPSGENKPSDSGKAQTYNYTFATGGTGGTYYPYGGALSQVFNANIPGMNMNVRATGGSKENILLVNNKEADIAIVQNDVMDYAYNGTYLFEGQKTADFSTLCTVYAEVCQLVVDADSGINSVADLKGKRVSVGDIGSGVEANSTQILAAYGLTFDDVKAEHLGFQASADLMKDKKVDAFFVTAGAPTTAVLELCKTNNVKILDLTGPEIDKLVSDYAFYTTYTIPKDIYGTEKDVETVAVKATLIVRSDLPEDVVYQMTKSIFDKKDEIAKAHAKGVELDVKKAVEGVTVPFHAGAEKYFTEVSAK